MIQLAALVIIIVFAGPFILSAVPVVLLFVTAFIIKFWPVIIAGVVVFFGSIFLYVLLGDSKLTFLKRGELGDGEKLPDHKSSDTAKWTQQERDAENERRRILDMPTLEASEAAESRLW